MTPPVWAVMDKAAREREFWLRLRRSPAKALAGADITLRPGDLATLERILAEDRVPLTLSRLMNCLQAVDMPMTRGHWPNVF